MMEVMYESLLPGHAEFKTLDKSQLKSYLKSARDPRVKPLPGMTAEHDVSSLSKSNSLTSY